TAFEKTEEETSTFKHPLIRKCCSGGAHRPEETCEQRAARITISQKCQSFHWCQTLLFRAPKSLQMVTAAMKLKDAYSLEEKL
uniref:Anaphylatoxin-like domain-containing protein n=1 Tax=Bos indicus x Bos taurus TaxID=30522 RepID=A0A4W2DIP9_BOBOX